MAAAPSIDLSEQQTQGGPDLLLEMLTTLSEATRFPGQRHIPIPRPQRRMDQGRWWPGPGRRAVSCAPPPRLQGE